jgi:hypothetical protein
VLGAASLGLPLEAKGEGIVSVLGFPPVSGVEVTCGDSGAIGDNGVMGAPIAEGGGEADGVVVVLGVEIVWPTAGSPRIAITRLAAIPDKAL